MIFRAKAEIHFYTIEVRLKSLSNLKYLLKFTFIKIAGENINLQLVKWAKVFGTKTMEELEQLADTEEVFESTDVSIMRYIEKTAVK